MEQFTIEQTPAEIVKLFPKASDIFKLREINFCCRGDQPLIDVVKKQRMDGDVLLTELNNAYKEWYKEEQSTTDWDQISPSDLINYITSAYLNNFKNELPALSGFVTRVYNVHGNRDPHLEELYRLYHLLKTEMEEHIAEEENKVFPLIKEGEASKAKIQELNSKWKNKYDAMVDLLEQIKKITKDFTPPEGACNTYQMTYARLAELESETLDYIHLENNILLTKI